MERMKKIKFFIFLAFAISCNTRQSGNKRSTTNDFLNEGLIKPIIKLNSEKDTESVILKFSGQIFKINYYKNKPQYIVLDNETFGKGVALNEFAQENKGIYYSVTDSSTIRAFGIKYLNGHNGIDVTINSGGLLQSFKVWENYTNNGLKYDFSNIQDGNLNVHKYKDGGVIDSFKLSKK
jgi:hypothetical protein